MATGAINLPEGFELDQPSNTPNLPPGFELDQPQQGEPLGNIPGNAINEVKGMFSGAKKLLTSSPQELGSMFKDPRTNFVWNALPHPTVNEQTGDVSFDPGSIYNQYKNITTHPYETFKKEPLGTTMALLPFAKPAASMLSKIPVIGDAIQGTSGLTKSVGSKLFAGAAQVPEESVAARYANPSIMSGPTQSEIAQNLPNIANKTNQVISGLSDAAKQKLSTSRYLSDGAFTKDSILGSIQSARRELGGIYTPEAQAASNAMDKIGENLNKIRNTVSQNQVHDLISDLDREIPWDKVWKSPENMTLTDHALIDIRTKLDGLLKTSNPEYSKVMGPLSEAINTRNEFLKRFQLQKLRGQGYQLGDQSVSRLGKAVNEDRFGTRQSLENIKNVTGEDIQSKIENAVNAQNFRPEPVKDFPTMFSNVRKTVAGKLIDTASNAVPKIKKVSDTASKFAPLVKPILTEDKAREFLSQSGGDINKARQMAIEAGYKIP
jgi:hypothetical protein